MQRLVREHEKHLEYVSLTAFFVLIALMFVVNPNLDVGIRSFFKDFRLEEAYQNIFLPAPKSEWAHKQLYNAVFQFCCLYAFTLVCVLVLMFLAHSPLYKKVRCAIAIVSWSALSVPTSLLLEEAIGWFTYLSYFLLLSIGSIVSILAVHFTLRMKVSIESIVFNYIKKHESKIRISECAQELGITEAEVKEALSLLQKKGLIETSG